MIKLVVENLEVAYGSRTVVSGVSMKASSGEIVGVLGPNGAGKTTILRAIAGIVKPRSGRIVVDGIDVARAPRREIARRVGYVPQRIQVPEGLSIIEYVLTGRRPWIELAPTRRDYEEVEKALRLVGIEHLAEKKASRVSGGELQLAAIARALASKPKILLLDEPTSHLDVRHQLELAELIQRLARREDIAIVVTLHDLTQAVRLADRIYLLNAGRIVAEGAPTDVINPNLIEKVYGVRVAVLKEFKAVIPLEVNRTR